MAPYPLVQLVQETFPVICTVATQLACKRKSSRLGYLGADLCSFLQETMNFTDGHKGDIERDGRLRKALEKLERAIWVNWVGRPVSSLEFPVFREISAIRRAWDKDPLKNSTAFFDLQNKIRKRLDTTQGTFDGIRDALQACREIHVRDDLDDVNDDFRSHDDDIPGYSKYAQLLHIVLSAHSRCRCTKEDETDQHWTRLRLRPVQQLAKGENIRFEFLFSASPNPARKRVFEWQDVHVLMPNVEQDKLVIPGDADGTSAELQLSSSLGLPLRDVLEKFRMRHGTRPILAYIIAKAIWHHYDSDWVSGGWTDHSIYFMGETSSDDGEQYFCKPYVDTDLNNSHRKVQEYRSAIGMMHKWPRVMALGILLLKIATGRPDTTEDHPEAWDAKTSNQNLVSLSRLAKDADFAADCNFPTYRAAVQKCLDAKLFKNAPFNKKNPTGNIEERKKIIYDEILAPLKQLIDATGWCTEFEDNEHVPFVPKDAPRSHFAVPLRVNSLSDFKDDKPHKEKGNTWLDNLDSVHEGIKLERTHSPRTMPVKIAILDTGYDRNSPSFNLPGAHKRVKAWKDFSGGSPEPSDVDGHGTHLATLLLRVAPRAHIFVARVAESSRGLEGADDNIAQAIHTAAVEWDVDFVSMSFGFVRHSDKISDAISAATRHKRRAICFFAAAANHGFNSREMFPANLGESVVSIRGTDGNGEFVQAFNPPRSSEEPMFGTLGKGVESDWASSDTRKVMSGCSVATPIAVGIAATVIDWAASKGEVFSPEELRLMHTRRGVFELFKEMGVHATDGRYYLAPFDLFSMRVNERIARIRTAIGKHPERW